MLKLLILGFLLYLVVGMLALHTAGCSEQGVGHQDFDANDGNKAMNPAAKSVELTIELRDSEKVQYTISNKTNHIVVTTTYPVLLVTYVVRPDGSRTPVTWDGYDTEMLPVRITDVLTLHPGASYRFSVALDTRRSGPLQQNDRLQAVLKTLPIHLVDKQIREAAQTISENFLKEEVTSELLTLGGSTIRGDNRD